MIAKVPDIATAVALFFILMLGVAIGNWSARQDQPEASRGDACQEIKELSERVRVLEEKESKR